MEVICVLWRHFHSKNYCSRVLYTNTQVGCGDGSGRVGMGVGVWGEVNSCGNFIGTIHL